MLYSFLFSGQNLIVVEQCDKTDGKVTFLSFVVISYEHDMEVVDLDSQPFILYIDTAFYGERLVFRYRGAINVLAANDHVADSPWREYGIYINSILTTLESDMAG